MVNRICHELRWIKLEDLSGAGCAEPPDSVPRKADPFAGRFDQSCPGASRGQTVVKIRRRPVISVQNSTSLFQTRY